MSKIIKELNDLVKIYTNKLRLCKDDSALRDAILNEYVILFNKYDNYEQHQLSLCFIDLCFDYEVKILLPLLYVKIPNLRNIMIDICKFSSELETDNDDIFYYDNMDVGFYVKCNDTIFQINKRENTSIIYDKRGNKYNVKDCEPLTKKEIRPYKISKLLNA